jgi:hypothetical protein
MSVVSSRQIHTHVCDVFSAQLSDWSFLYMAQREREKEREREHRMARATKMLNRWTTHEEEMKTDVELKRTESKEQTGGMKNEKHRLPVGKLYWWCFPSFFFHRHYYRSFPTKPNAFWQIEWFSLSLSFCLE